MTATIKNNVLTVTLPIDGTFAPSASGKTLRVATTNGNAKTGIKVKTPAGDREVIIGVNAYCYPEAK